jgi:hypothetical protein
MSASMAVPVHAPQAVHRRPFPARPAVPALKPGPVSTPDPVPALQRCACGGGCPACRAKSSSLPTLTINAPHDAYEREADRQADAVMGGGPVPPATTAVPAISRVRRHRDAGTGTADAGAERAATPEGGAPSIVHEVLRAPGEPLQAGTRAFMEARFGVDFGHVRVHRDGRAADSARAVDALAYTVGHDVVFGAGRYSPGTRGGDRLLAHELTHVVQQNTAGRLVQREMVQNAIDPEDPHQTAEPVKCVNEGCPESFCTPFSSPEFARQIRAGSWAYLLGGIATFVDQRVVPLWYLHLNGGTDERDLTGSFGMDFTTSKTTAQITDFLVRAMKWSLHDFPPAVPPGQGTTTIDCSQRLHEELAEIDDQLSDHPMDFAYPKEIPGNIAGGIDKRQTRRECRAGAKPSALEDKRTAQVSATIKRLHNGTLLVLPSITYTVWDTIDLCPGNCGDWYEVPATLLLSRLEATRVSGDVPFTVQFSAPASLLKPFLVGPPPPGFPTGLLSPQEEPDNERPSPSTRNQEVE